jgi:hypothetical protein
LAIPLDEVVTFDLITRGSGGVTDADSAPTYDIFEDTTDTPILAAQTMTKRTSLTGNYRGSFTASAANGFEAGKWYNVIGTGIVGGIIDKTVAMTFMLCAAESAAGVPKVDAAYLLGTAIATPATAGILDVNAKNWGNSVVTGMPMPTYTQPTGFLAATFPAGTIANTTNITAGTITTVTTLTNLPSITANWLTAAGINAGALNGKGDWLLASSYTAPPTTTQIATGVWTDTTAGDFTTALSIGKSVMNGVALGTGLTVNALTTNNDKTGYSLAANQHVIVDSGTVTTLTNLPAITAGWLTATGIAASALNGKGDWLLSSSTGSGLSAIPDLAGVTTLLARLTSARGGYLDNLNVGGNVASSAEVTSIQNNTRIVRVVPDDIELPAAGTRTYRIELFLYDAVGNMEAPDSAPTIALVNQAGTDRSSRLDSTTMTLVETGRYRAVYASTAGDAKEQLVWAFSVVEGGATRKYGNTSWITDAIATDFTTSDRTALTDIQTKIGTPVTQGSGATLAANLTDIAAGDFGYHLDLATKIGTPVDLGSGTPTLAANLFDLDNKIGVPATSLSGDIAGVPDALLGRNAAGGSNGGKTVAYYLQGGLPKIVQSADGLTVSIYGADGTTVIATDTLTRLLASIGGVKDITQG